MSRKYFKTPDVATATNDGYLYSSCGACILETDKLTEEECKLFLIFLGKIGMHKCTYNEITKQDIPSPFGIIEYHPTIVFKEPSGIKEIEEGVFEIDGKIIDTGADAELVKEQLYGDCYESF